MKRLISFIILATLPLHAGVKEDVQPSVAKLREHYLLLIPLREKIKRFEDNVLSPYAFYLNAYDNIQPLAHPEQIEIDRFPGGLHTPE